MHPDPRPGPPAGLRVRVRAARYESGDWDYNPKVAANVLNSVVRIHDIPVYPKRSSSPRRSDELMAFPFLFMTGHKLVRFSRDERERCGATSSTAGCSSRTTAITT